MSVKERIYKFTDQKCITIRRFEELCGLSNGYVSSMRKGLGTRKLNNVLTAFPELNRDWLLYGEGDMIKKVEHISDDTTDGDSNNDAMNRILQEIVEQRRLMAEVISVNKEMAATNRDIVATNRELVRTNSEVVLASRENNERFLQMLERLAQ